MSTQQTDLIVFGAIFPASVFDTAFWQQYLDDVYISGFDSGFDPDQIYLVTNPMNNNPAILGYILAKACREKGDYITDPNSAAFPIPSIMDYFWNNKNAKKLAKLIELMEKQSLLKVFSTDQWGVWYLCRHS